MSSHFLYFCHILAIFLYAEYKKSFSTQKFFINNKVASRSQGTSLIGLKFL